MRATNIAISQKDSFSLSYNLIYNLHMTNLLEAIKKECIDKNATIACAESITLGKLTYTIGSISGASRFLLGGIIAYQDKVKEHILGVPAEMLKTYSAVSNQTCTEMINGIKRIFSPTIALATTGYAGPQVLQEPVGLVFIGVCIRDNLSVHKFKFSGSRREIQDRTVEKAIEILWEKIKSEHL